FGPGADDAAGAVAAVDRVVVAALGHAVARALRPAHAGVHVEAEDDVLVGRRALVDDVVVPEDDVLRLGVRPLEAAYLHAQAEAAPRRVARVRAEVPGVVVLVVHHEERLLVRVRALAEEAVPRPAPAGVV